METSIGENIKQLRKEKKWTQEVLAKKVGVSKQVISNWERYISRPDHSDIFNLAKVFDISADYILGNDIDAYNADHNSSISEIHKEYYENVISKNSNDTRFRKDINLIGTNDLIEIIFSDVNLEIYDIPLTKDDKFMLADLIHILFSWKSDIQEKKG